VVICGRCERETAGVSMSYFDTALICLDCDAIEVRHPAHAEAVRREEEAVRRGETNFRGVGVPADLGI
jgi:hypothetical protein